MEQSSAWPAAAGRILSLAALLLSGCSGGCEGGDGNGQVDAGGSEAGVESGVEVAPIAMVSAVAVDPPTARVPVGATVQLRAVLEYTAGQRPSPEPTATWMSSDASVATVDGTGKVSGLRTGEATITATAGGKTGTAVVTVEQKQLTGVAISGQSSVRVGGTLSLTLNGTYADGTSADVTAAADWSSSDETVLGVGNGGGAAKGLVTGRKLGRATVIARVGTREARLELEVRQAAPTSLVVLPAQVTVAVGARQDLRALVSYPDGTVRDVTAQASWSSSNASIASTAGAGAPAGRVQGVSAGEATMTVMADGLTATSQVRVAAAVSLRAAPSAVTLAVGGKQRLEARATFSDGGTQDVSAQVTWASASMMVATVTAEGVVTAAAAGTTDVTVTLGALSDAAAVTVSAATLSTLVVVPASLRVPAGVSLPLQVFAGYSDGSRREVSSEVTWTSAAPARATVAAASDGQRSILTIPAEAGTGSVILTAALGERTATATITVTDATVAALAVQPSRATIAAGSTTRLRATALLSDGSSLDLTEAVSWQSSSLGVAHVETSPAGPSLRAGTVTGVSGGASTVTARLGQVSDTSALTVLAAAPTALHLEPVSVRLASGTSTRLSAVAAFADGRFQDVTESASWTFSADELAWVTGTGPAAGTITGTGVGTGTARASFGGLSATIPVRVTSARLRTLAVVPGSARVAAGSVLDYRANGTFSDGTVQDVTALVRWDSASPEIAEIIAGGPEAGRARAVGPGAAVLVARLGSILASASLTVTSATPSTITIEPAPARLARGTTLQLRAVARLSDDTTQDVTAAAFWTAVDPAIADVAVGGRDSGVATGLAPGSTMVRASWLGISVMAALEVTAATLTGIDVTPASTFVPSGLTQQYQATGRFSDGTTQPLREATWSVSGPAARVSNLPATRGLVTGISEAEVMVSASFGGQTGSAMLSVISAAYQRLVVTPPAPVVILRDTSVALRAFAEYSDGTSEDVTEQASWVSAASGVVSVSDTPVTRGRALGIAPGSATITARFDAKAATTSVTVSSATLSSLTITPSPVRVAPGAATPLRAVARLSDMTTQDVTISAIWTSGNSAVATVGNTPPTEGLLRGVGAGTTMVRATLKGIEATATVEVP